MKVKELIPLLFIVVLIVGFMAIWFLLDLLGIVVGMPIEFLILGLGFAIGFFWLGWFLNESVSRRQ